MRVAAAVLLCALVGTLACQPAAAPPAAAPAESEIAAEFDGGRITMAEVDRAAGARLAELQDQVYALRRAALEGLLDERLQDQRARREGISRDELIHREVETKIDEPTSDEVARFIRDNRARMPAGSDRDLAIQVESGLRDLRIRNRGFEFRRELWHDADVRIRLAARREDVAIPPDAPTLGPPAAPVTLIEFADYQCPYCRKAQQNVEALLRRFEGKIRFVYRDLPLGLHERAFAAARAARCAQEQGRFWEYHEDLLNHPDELTDDQFVERAHRLKLDVPAFGACLASQRPDAAIRASLAEAERLGLAATPTFFLNGRRFTGSPPLERFVGMIEEELIGAP